MNQKIIHFTNKVARKAQKRIDLWAMNYWHSYPFGQYPHADKETYIKLWDETKSQQYKEIDDFENEKKIAIDKNWLDDLALHTQIVIKDSNLCYQHGRVLYTALRDYMTFVKKQWNDSQVLDNARMVTILETGTARGFSATVMAKALNDEETCGKIITLDLLPHNVKMYWNCIDDNDGIKTRQELLAPWKNLIDPYIIFMENDSRIGISRTAMGRINFAFLDGAHTYDDIIIEFNMVQQQQEQGDVIVFDDYNPGLFPGIVKGVDVGCEKWGYSKVVIKSRDDRAYVIAKKIR